MNQETNPANVPMDELNAERRARGRVFVVDDDPALLAALVEILALEGYACTGFTSAAAFLAQFVVPEGEDMDPVCLLCDVKLPGLDGLDLQDQLKPYGEVPVLLMSGDSGALEAARGFRAGALDFLVKPMAVDQLLEAVSRALAVSSDRRADRVRAMALSSRLTQLTPREREVAQLVVIGQTNAEIGERLGIGLRTVKLHRHHAMLKLGARTLADLVRIADEAGL